MGTWRLLDHPADLAIEGSGNTAEEAFESLLSGLAEQALGRPTSLPGEERSLEIEGMDREECLVGALNEVLYWINVKGTWPRGFRIVEFGEQRLLLTARCGVRAPGQALLQEVKAATYHDLDLCRDEAGTWRLRVLFDV